jgi:hypothetical protein
MFAAGFSPPGHFQGATAFAFLSEVDPVVRENPQVGLFYLALSSLKVGENS